MAKVIAIDGPSGTGKSKLIEGLAKRFEGAVVIPEPRVFGALLVLQKTSRKSLQDLMAQVPLLPMKTKMEKLLKTIKMTIRLFQKEMTV